MGNSTLIQQYASSVMRTMKDQADAVARLEHKLSKGRFREIFVQTVLAQFLTHQFGVGSGIVVNQKGEQSTEHDVIIFDRRILPPFIASGALGVFPVEAVIATVEVKSILTSDAIQQAEAAAAKLHAIHRTGTIYDDSTKERPLTAIVGFQAGSIACDPICMDKACPWLSDIKSLFAICLVGRFSWLRLNGWQARHGDDDFEETKRFVAALLDNVRTKAERRYQMLLTAKHRDWLSVYTRWDCSGAAVLRGEPTTVVGTTPEPE